MNLEKDISNKLYWGRFICAVTVIAIHSVNNNIQGVLYDVEYIIRDYVLCFAVPFFFVLSGFIFYYGMENEIFYNKWKKRLKKQLYLYLLWNLLFTLIHTTYVIVRNTEIAFSILGQSMVESSVSLKSFWGGVTA